MRDYKYNIHKPHKIHFTEDFLKRIYYFGIPMSYIHNYISS